MMMRCLLESCVKSSIIRARLVTLSSTETNFLSTTWMPYEEGSATCS